MTEKTSFFKVTQTASFAKEGYYFNIRKVVAYDSNPPLLGFFRTERASVLSP